MGTAIPNGWPYSLTPDQQAGQPQQEDPEEVVAVPADDLEVGVESELVAHVGAAGVE